MQPQLETIKGMTVVGIEIRTTNVQEMRPSGGKIPGLWQRFGQEQICNKVASKVSEFPIAVYCKYVSDHTEAFSVLAGFEVSDIQQEISAGMLAVNIPAGNYLVFAAKGPMPQTVIDVWQSIWRYFSENPPHTRIYVADFERYTAPDAVEIYIGVK